MGDSDEVRQSVRRGGSVDRSNQRSGRIRKVYRRRFDISESTAKISTFNPSAEINNLNIPILILAGSEDDGNGNPQRLSGAMPKAKFQLVKGDHNNTYTSKEFAEAVMEFIRK